MINREFTVSMIQTYAANNTISAEVFNDLVDGLEMNEIEEVFAILVDLGIRIVEGDNDDVAMPKSLDVAPMYSCFEIKKMSRLTNEELCVLLQRGDELAKSALAEKNKRLIYKIAHQCFMAYRPETLEEEELYSVGYMGLITAAEKFDVTKGFMFSTYACWWIRQAISREIMNTGYPVRLPVHVIESLSKIRKCARKHRLSSVEELQTALAREGQVYSIEKLKKLLLAGDRATNVIRLNTLVGEEEKTEHMEFIPSPVNVEEEVMKTMMSRDVSRILRKVLTAREWDVIQKRFGLNGYTPMTLDVIGKQQNVTRERIRQIEAKALNKLKCSRYASSLKEYLAA